VEPRASEPTADNTDVGDWFSCSEMEKFGEEDLSDFSGIRSFFSRGCANLRG
jgi:hypothetical protein